MKRGACFVTVLIFEIYNSKSPTMDTNCNVSEHSPTMTKDFTHGVIADVTVLETVLNVETLATQNSNFTKANMETAL